MRLGRLFSSEELLRHRQTHEQDCVLQDGLYLDCIIKPFQGMHCTKIPRICAGAEAPKVAAPEVPYAQPGLKAILADAVQWDSFRDFLALGLPGGFMMQLEGNSYDITTLLAGLLGELAVRPQ